MKHPFDRAEIKDGVPHTNTGMTGTGSTIMPEYHVGKKIEFRAGDIAEVFDKNGKLMKTYKFEVDKLTEEPIGWVEQNL